MSRINWHSAWTLIRRGWLYVALLIVVGVSIVLSSLLWHSPERSVDVKTAVSGKPFNIRDLATVYNFSGLLVIDQAGNGKAYFDYRPKTDKLASQLNDTQVRQLKTRKLNAEQYQQALDRKNVITMLLPDKVGTTVLKSLLGKQFTLSSGATVNRIQLLNGKGHEVVLFSDQKHRVYRFKVVGDTPHDFSVGKARTSTPAKLTLNDDKVCLDYLAPMKMQTYRYLLGEDDLNTKANQIFSGNRHVVKRQTGTDTVTYSDSVRERMQLDSAAGKAVLDIYGKKRHVSGTNQRETKGFDWVEKVQPATSSINFFYVDNQKGLVVYRPFVNGLPVFDDANSGVVRLQQVDSDHQRITFSNRSLQVPLPIKEQSTVTLPSTAVAREIGRANGLTKFETSKLFVGYQWTQSDNGKIVVLQPAWFYRKGQVWQPVPGINAQQ